MKNNIDETEIPKYKKRKNSSLSKIKARTNHKHEYEHCLLVSTLNEKEYVYKAEFCRICGKIQQVKFFESLTLSSEETREKYKGLKELHIEDIFTQKYVAVVQE